MTLRELHQAIEEILDDDAGNGDQQVMVVVSRIAGRRPFYYPIESVKPGGFWGLGVATIEVRSTDRRSPVLTLGEKAY